MASILDLAEHAIQVPLLDVACGTGGHLRHLRHHYKVAGVDLDPGMLDVARANVPDVELVQADMRALDLASMFDAIVCLFSSIGYMRSVDELHTAISRMARHFNPRGVLVVDGWVRPDAWIGGVTTHVDVAETEEIKVVAVSRARREGKATISKCITWWRHSTQLTISSMSTP